MYNRFHAAGSHGGHFFANGNELAVMGLRSFIDPVKALCDAREITGVTGAVMALCASLSARCDYLAGVASVRTSRLCSFNTQSD